MHAIVVVDYGMGNLRSVAKAFEAVGAQAIVSSDPAIVRRASKVVLPGVGAFPSAMRELSARGLIAPIKEAIASGTPYLGICLGLQLLFESSEEGEGARGLGILQGTVRRFNVSPLLKVPHMGWNQAMRRQATSDKRPSGCPVLKDIPDGMYVYFVHSYYGAPVDQSVVALETDYGGRFVSMVWRDNLYATQFHPEKSQAVGLQLLRNFINLSDRSIAQ